VPCGSDFDEELENRVFQFLELVLAFIARTINTGFEPLPSLLHDIFSEQSHAFYIRNTGRGVCEDITDIGDMSEGGGSRNPESNARERAR
jgi:hypothetical protein